MAQQDPTPRRKVTTIPAGYTERIGADGKKEWFKVTKEEKPRVVIPDNVRPPSTKVSSSGKPKRRTPNPSTTPPSDNGTEDIIVMDEQEPSKKATVTYGGVNTNRREVTEAYNPNYKTFNFPDESGNFSNKGIRKQAIGKQVIDASKSYDSKGNFVPFYTGEILSDGEVTQIAKPSDSGVNKANPNKNTMFLKPGTMASKTTSSGTELNTQNTPDLNNYKGFVEQKYDKLGRNTETPNVGIQNNAVTPTDGSLVKEVGKMYDAKDEPVLIKGKFANGGLVGKIKGMYDGGNVPYNPYQVNNTEMQPTENPISGQGIIQMAGATQFTPTGNAVNSQGATSVVANNTANVQGNSGVKPPKTEQQLKNEKMARGTANAAGEALGAYGSSYYGSKVPTSEGDSARSAGLSAVSKSGAIGGAVGGIAAIGDKIGAPIKNRSESVNTSTGELNSESRTKRNAVIGIALSPSKRLTYKGGLTDVTGQKYIDSIENKTKGQLAEVKAANAQDKIKQAMAARDAGNFDPTITNLHNTNGATFDENKNLVLSDNQQFDYKNKYANGGLVGKVKQMCADGGVIKGKGTGKSDSINAKVETDSFVVPAQNAPIAEELRKKYLGTPPKVKADLKQPNGVPVKLSNNEHLFSPEEKQELLNKGVNVDLLAPKSEEKAVKKEMMSFPNVTGYRNGGKVGEKVGNATWDGKKWVGADGSVYSDSYIEKMDKEASNAKVKETEYRVHQLSKHYDKIKDAPDRKDESLRVKAEIDALSGKAVSNKEIAKVASGVKAPSVRVPKVSKESFAPIQPIDATKSALTQDAEMRDVQLAKKQEASIEAASGKQQAAYDNGVKTNAEYVKANSPKTNSKFGALAGRIDPTMLAGIGQTALGLNMLKNEKRPLDQTKLDSTYDANVNRAQADAQFGYTPEQSFTLEQARQNAENDSRFSARNFAGGNAGTAFNQERQAINQGWMNKLGLANENQQLRMDKQRYADQEVQQRAGIKQGLSRIAFGDAMYTFQQKQQAGSELIGAGINNTIGAIRYQQELDAMEKADKQRNAWLGTV